MFGFHSLSKSEVDLIKYIRDNPTFASTVNYWVAAASPPQVVPVKATLWTIFRSSARSLVIGAIFSFFIAAIVMAILAHMALSDKDQKRPENDVELMNMAKKKGREVVKEVKAGALDKAIKIHERVGKMLLGEKKDNDVALEVKNDGSETEEDRSSDVDEVDEEEMTLSDCAATVLEIQKMMEKRRYTTKENCSPSMGEEAVADLKTVEGKRDEEAGEAKGESKTVDVEQDGKAGEAKDENEEVKEWSMVDGVIEAEKA